MAVDMFLKLDGIKGESGDHKHKEEIQIESFSWGASQLGGHSSGGGGGMGKASVADVHCTKFVDKSSAALALHCLTGKHIPNGLITVRKAGDKPLEYLKIKLVDILISGIQLSGHGSGDRVAENLSINYSKIFIEYQEQKADGSGAPGGEMGYDVKANQKV